MKASFVVVVVVVAAAAAGILVCFGVSSEVGMMLIVSICVGLLYALKMVWLNPWQIRRKLGEQGIKGPKPCFLYGNVWEMKKIQAAAAAAAAMGDGDHHQLMVAHDYTSTLFPYFQHWTKLYGPIFTYSTGMKQHLYVNEPELVKEMNHCKAWELGKPSYITRRLAPMLGNGILRSNGHIWAHQRKIVAPQFFMDKVKGMVGMMMESAESLTSKWEGYVESSEVGKIAEIRADEDLRGVSADVISKACFGSSYLKGKHIFSKLRTLQKAISQQSFLFGSNAAFGFLEQNKIEDLEKEVERLIWEVVKERERDCEEKETKLDLLQLILEATAANDEVDDKECCRRFIVDNCKNIYFAGHESTAVAASWCLMLLALHPQWQSNIRDEMFQLSRSDDGGGFTADSLPKLKTVTMVIQEVLRLYPPGAFVSREVLQETKIGHIVVPKGVCLWTLIPTLHRDPDIWGPDVNEFHPERFVDGISKACKLPQVYIPFGLGPRVCLGRNFALVELKVLIAVIVSKFTFTLSPNYVHSPAYRMIVEPGQGLHLLIRRCTCE